LYRVVYSLIYMVIVMMIMTIDTELSAVDVYGYSFFLSVWLWSLQPITRSSCVVDALLLAMLGSFYAELGGALHREGNEMFVGCNNVFCIFTYVIHPFILWAILMRHITHHVSRLLQRVRTAAQEG